MIQIKEVLVLLLSFLAFREVRAQELTVVNEVGNPIEDYTPGSYAGRVFGCCSPRHLGEDIKADPLTPVYAIASGKIIEDGISGAHTCFGMVVVIEHRLGIGTKFISVYGHLSNREGYKPKLQGIVEIGDVVGYLAHSGGNPPSGKKVKCGAAWDDENGDGGPHLHFGIRLGQATKNQQGKYIWVYYGYAGHGEDVDYDAQGQYFGGKFTKPSSFIENLESNEDQDRDGYTISQGDCNDSDPYIHPGEQELCDNKDNDCDGETDELWPNRSTSCSKGKGECFSQGQWVCKEDKLSLICTAPTLNPQAERCDNKDNDCDGTTDENFPEKGQPCTVGIGECQVTGVGVCIESDPTTVYCSQAPLQPQPELCDDKDNDCDNQTDEDFPSKGQPCTVGMGECQATGIGVCSLSDPTKLLCSVAPRPPQNEVCDNKDNDCDGQTDEDLPDIACGVGVCQHTVVACLAGITQTCNPQEGVSAEICDGLDNDCNNQTDEGTLCDDGIQCTDDYCQDGECLHFAKNSLCKDNNPCNGIETCDRQLGCLPGINLINGTLCKDGNWCNGTETCQDGVCMPGQSIQCNEGKTCCPADGKCIGAGQCCYDSECSSPLVCVDNWCDYCVYNTDCEGYSAICCDGECKIGNCCEDADCEVFYVPCCAQNRCLESLIDPSSCWFYK